MTTLETGNRAESAAAEHLKSLGYKIIDRNWRTRYCEIDIVAQKKKRLYFVEVKYRGSDNYGSGLEYITRQKLSKMRLAAEMWVQSHNWRHDYGLAAIEVTGEDYAVTNFLSDISG